MSNPKLRFRREDGTNYPDWEDLKMRDIFTEIIEKNRSDLPVLSILQGRGTVYRDSSDRNILYDKKSTTNYKAMKKGDFIIHLRTFEGGLECATLDGISSPAYKILRTNKLVSEAYKDYFRSRSFIEGRLAIAVTGVRDGKNIEMSTFWDISVPVPCLEEQQKIADFLSSVDEVIAQSEAEVSNLQQQKKAAMQKIFSQEVRFRRDDGTEFPKWESRQISDFAICFAGATPSTSTKEYWNNGTISWLSSGEVNKKQIYETEKKISQLGYDKCSTKMVKPNTVIMALAGQGKTRGTVAITRIPVCTNQSLCAIETDDTVIDDYLYQYLETRYDDLRHISSGDGTRGGLNLKLINNYTVSIPHTEEQQKIANLFSAYDEAIGYAKQELDKWKEFKKGLLQQMFV